MNMNTGNAMMMIPQQQQQHRFERSEAPSVLAGCDSPEHKDNHNNKKSPNDDLDINDKKGDDDDDDNLSPQLSQGEEGSKPK